MEKGNPELKGSGTLEFEPQTPHPLANWFTYNLHVVITSPVVYFTTVWFQSIEPHTLH